jgi:hypothetical protein
MIYNQAQKKRQKKIRERNTDIGRSTKKEGDPPPRRLSEKFHMLLAHQITAYQATPSTRKATTMMLLPRLVLGFPPVRERV